MDYTKFIIVRNCTSDEIQKVLDKHKIAKVKIEPCLHCCMTDIPAPAFILIAEETSDEQIATAVNVLQKYYSGLKGFSVKGYFPSQHNSKPGSEILYRLDLHCKGIGEMGEFWQRCQLDLCKKCCGIVELVSVTPFIGKPDDAIITVLLDTYESDLMHDLYAVKAFYAIYGGKACSHQEYSFV